MRLRVYGQPFKVNITKQEPSDGPPWKRARYVASAGGQLGWGDTEAEAVAMLKRRLVEAYKPRPESPEAAAKRKRQEAARKAAVTRAERRDPANDPRWREYRRWGF